MIYLFYSPYIGFEAVFCTRLFDNKIRDQIKSNQIKKVKKSSVNDEQENRSCIVCGELFNDSKSRENG